MGNDTHAQTCVLNAGQLLLPAPYQFSTRSAWATGKTTLSYRTPAWCRYYLHAYGSVYGVTGRVASDVIARNAASLRMLANEGARVTTGFWPKDCAQWSTASVQALQHTQSRKWGLPA